MSKRSPAAASKRARNAKTQAKAERPKAAVLITPKVSARIAKLSAGRDVNTSASELRSNAHVPSISAEPVPRLEVTDAEFQAPRRKVPATLQDRVNQSMTSNAIAGGLQPVSATAQIHAYQAELLDFVLANMQFAFELAHGLATIKSPLDVFDVTTEFTGKRIALFEKQLYQSAS
jgi:hypothetical protein